VLLIEDNPDMSQFVAGLLGAEFAVRVAQSGDQGLAQARAQLPDLIISDVMMPGMSGFDLVRALRGDPHTAGIPVILMTALDSVEDRMEAVDGGADAYLRKPFQPRELLGAVRALLRKHKRQVNLVQEDREQALRVLAEGVAHEVLNPIGFLQNALYILHELCTEACDLVQPPGPRLAEMRSEAERSHAAGREGIARVRDAVEALRRFSRGGGLEPGAAGDVNAVLQRVVTLVGVRGLSIQVTTELDATRRVTLRSGQLEQVLLNLLINAAHATEGRQGRVVLRSWDHPQGGVGISVSDDGPGIAAEVLEKVFYPYFTTKEPGKGTGLGLSLAREMVRQHGGSLTAASELGKGATFTIWLPEASVPAPGSSTGLAAAAPVPTAGPVPLRPPAPDAGA
jgi:signal transduction histidine kinase